MRFATKAIRLQNERSQEQEHSVPLFLTSSFVYNSAEEMSATFGEEIEGNIYSRFINPNLTELGIKMAALENTEAAYPVASGMGAIYTTFMSLLKTGDHVISCNAIFGSSHTILSKFFPKYGMAVTYVNMNDYESWENAVTPNSKLFFLETPTNPGLDIVDLEKAAAFAHKHNMLLVVDNCFASPVGQTPADFGADVIIHSATKWIDGQGRVLGGVICASKAIIKEIIGFVRSAGPSLSPFNAWILSKSLETLDVRMERHCNNALYIAAQLEHNEKIAWLKYPFLKSHPDYEIAKKQMRAGGGIVCFELKGGLQAGINFLNNLKLLSLSGNLGDTRSIASHPASTTHARITEEERLEVNITPGLIRISVGLEDKDDILEDILQALSFC